jgi:2,4-dienoyl-CoA reductase-like NADH-dependent reductase (Old Yellow Enzyme family)
MAGSTMRREFQRADNAAALAAPLEIRGIVFRNRFVQAPMCAMYAAPDGSATRQNVEYYRARAAGGVALAIVEITFTDSAGSRAFHAQLGAHHDTMIPGLSDVAEAICSQGAVPGLQLGHCGPQRVISEGPVVAPSPIAWAPGKPIPVALTTEQISRIVHDHAAATRRAVAAGFQFVELHAAHGYLVNTFLMPAINLRTDEYGGSFENRMRFLLEIVAVMRQELGPRRLLGIRLNGDDLLPGGLGVDEYCQVARLLADHGVDLLHVSAGTYRVMEKRIPPMYLPNEGFAGYAGAIRRASGLPVIASGTIHDMDEANCLVAAGDADFVALARPLFADPDLPNKVLSNRCDHVVPCIRCNICLAREQGGRRGYCAVNPGTGHEHERPPPPRSTRIINIIGAGPAGIQMAITAAGRGHRVILWERRAAIGGQLRSAARLPFKHTLPRLLDYYEAALKRANVTVHLGETVTAADVNADVVVLATGPTWHASSDTRTTIPALSPESAIAELDSLGPRILVVGGGLIGAEMAWALSLAKRDVVLAERDDDFADDINLVAKIVLAEQLARQGVDVRFHTDVTELVGRTARMCEGGAARNQDFDAVVWTARSGSEAESAANERFPPTIAIGERGGARGLYEATSSAHRAALAL